MADGMTMPRSVPSPHTSEASFQKEVMAAAKLFGWTVCHVAPALTKRGKWTTPTSIPGWPDLTFIRPGEHFWAELKTDIGKLSDAQKLCIAAMRLGNCEVHVWAPRDWDRIVERLAA
jgi:hypothetical protein